jgi:apolipoprotein N-acyltransferase
VALAPRPRLSLARAFGLGLAAGGVYFAGTIYWVTHVIAVYGGVPLWVGLLVNALFIAVLALFPAVFAVIMRQLLIAHGSRAYLAAPFAWVATELARTVVFTGFPWVLLGYSQAAVLPIAQLASLFGVFGVSALVASVSAAAAFWATTSEWAPRLRSAGLVGALILAVALWGGRRAAHAVWTHEGVPLRVGLVQGNVDQGLKWNPALASSIFEEYLNLSQQAVEAGAQLVVWPESSTPFMLEENRRDGDRVRAMARAGGVSMLVGSDQIAHGQPRRYFNAAFLVANDGSTAGVYRKIHLVPFGEYVPFKRLLFFAGPLVQTVSDFSAGREPVLLPVNGHWISTAICYEIVYPGLVREFVRAGSELLTTITNDAWFGATSAPYQHFAQASMRAVEEGRFLVRSANTGISGIVDPYGRVLAATPIYEPAVLVETVRLLTVRTIYSATGDLFASLSAIGTAALLLASRRRIT